MVHKIEDEDLLFHILNVGFGDNIIVEFPADGNGQRSYGLVDCYNSGKTKKYLEKLRNLRSGYTKLKFICATHPHLDHINGILPFLKDKEYQPEEFWDSGFRHSSSTYLSILETLLSENIRMIRISSGMEMYFGRVQVTALAPSVALRNRYATYGVDVNNASIVLRFEHHDKPVLMVKSKEFEGASPKEEEREASPAVVILAGDAEFDSWSHICQEYPRLEKTVTYLPLVTKIVNYLECSVVKVAHHGSMHSAPLDIYEKMKPKKAIISSKQKVSDLKVGNRTLRRTLFPHQSAVIALEEIGAELATTDGSYESMDEDGTSKNLDWAHEGSLVIVVPPGKKPLWKKLNDAVEETGDPPLEI